MKLTYWYAGRIDDRDCYSIVAKTKKECLDIVNKTTYGNFELPVKRVIEYKDAFDLLSIVGSMSKSAGVLVK